MAINITTIYDRMCRTFGVAQTSERFRLQFVDATNDVIRDLETYSFVEVAEIADISSDIDLDAKYTNVFVTGVKSYLQQNKEWGIEPDTLTETRYRRELAHAQTLQFDDNAPYVRYQEDDD